MLCSRFTRPSLVSDFQTESDYLGTKLIEILESHKPSSVAKIETQLRNVTYHKLYEIGVQTGSFNPSRDLDIINRIIAAEPLMASILTTSSIGYVREHALELVDEISGPFSLALILRRLNDWVPQVRNAAFRAIERLIFSYQDEKIISAVADCVELILDNCRYGRIGDVERNILSRLIALPRVYNSWEYTICSSKRSTSEKYLRLGLQQSQFTDILPKILKESPNPRTRNIALTAMLKKRFTWKEHRKLKSVALLISVEENGILERGLQDKSVEVQVTALRYLVNNKSNVLDNEQTYRRFVSSSYQRLQTLAAIGLKQLGLNLESELRDILQNHEPPPLWAARIYPAFGGYSQLIYDAHERAAQSQKIKFLKCAAREGHSNSVRALHDIALKCSDLSKARSASNALRSIGERIYFFDLYKAASNPDEFFGRGVFQFVKECTPIEITRIIALISNTNHHFETDSLWEIVARKRLRGPFLPKQSDLNALIADFDGQPILMERVEKVLGLQHLSKITPG